MKINNLRAFKANIAGRRERMEGRDHLVFPVVAIVEGVHNNMYYPTTELRKFVEAWNGVPVPVQHPTDTEGGPVSANSPEIIDDQVIGRFWNARFDDNKLRGEIWIDVVKAQLLAPDVLSMLSNDHPVEVSTGLFTEGDGVPGTWGEEQYEQTLINYRPDHLAVLPGGTGACSWDDGCGIRANKEQAMTKKYDKVKLNTLVDQVTNEEEPGVFKRALIALKGVFSPNETSYRDISGMIQTKLDAMDIPGEVFYYLEAAFDDDFVYRVENATAGTTKLLRRNYTVANGNVEFSEELKEVTKDISYVPVNNNADEVDDSSSNSVTPNEKENNDMTEHEKAVDNLIANSDTDFSADDKGSLMKLSLCQLKKMYPEIETNEDCGEASAAPDTNDGSDDADNSGSDDADNSGSDDAGSPDVNANLTAEQYIANAPAELQDVLNNSLNMHKIEKAKLVTLLTANDNCTFTPAQLEAKDLSELQALAKLATPTASATPAPNYGGQGGGAVLETNAVEDDVEVMTAPEMDWKN